MPAYYWSGLISTLNEAPIFVTPIPVITNVFKQALLSAMQLLQTADLKGRLTVALDVELEAFSFVAHLQ